jgi:hypothetical protein
MIVHTPPKTAPKEYNSKQPLEIDGFVRYAPPTLIYLKQPKGNSRDA